MQVREGSGNRKRICWLRGCSRLCAFSGVIPASHCSCKRKDNRITKKMHVLFVWLCVRWLCVQPNPRITKPASMHCFGYAWVGLPTVACPKDEIVWSCAGSSLYAFAGCAMDAYGVKYDRIAAEVEDPCPDVVDLFRNSSTQPCPPATHTRMQFFCSRIHVPRM